MSSADQHPSTARMVWRGMRRRCPCCGGGKLFRGYFTMKPACPRCGHCFEPRAEEGFFLGALTVNLGVTQTVILLGLFVALERQRAQLELIRGRRYGHPFYRSAFVWMGSAQ
jgi:uncharacterized protein (DUF983 family)